MTTPIRALCEKGTTLPPRFSGNCCTAVERPHVGVPKLLAFGRRETDGDCLTGARHTHISEDGDSRSRGDGFVWRFDFDDRAFAQPYFPCVYPQAVPVPLASVGIAIGTVAALQVTRVMAALLFELTPTDPITLGTVVIVLFGVALLASYLPARRATRVDPVISLRAE